MNREIYDLIRILLDHKDETVVRTALALLCIYHELTYGEYSEGMELIS